MCAHYRLGSVATKKDQETPIEKAAKYRILFNGIDIFANAASQAFDVEIN
jgi:hypothetical protein